MATLRNKRKLAAVSRETPESSRGSRGRNVIDAELRQNYISQVSEEIEGRVTKRLYKEFNKTESRILVLYRNLTSFFLTHKCGLVPSFKERPGMLTQKTGKLMGITPQTVLIPKGGIFLTTLDNSTAQRPNHTLIWYPKTTLTVTYTITSQYFSKCFLFLFEADFLKSKFEFLVLFL